MVAEKNECLVLSQMNMNNLQMWAKLSGYLTYLGKAIQSRGNRSNKNAKKFMYHGLGIVLVQTTIKDQGIIRISV